MRSLPYLVVLLSFVGVSYGIKCYICNSAMQSDCLDNYDNGRHESYCPVKAIGRRKPIKATGCRIVRQYVAGSESVVRECAYYGENVAYKSQKGSTGVSRIITQCDSNLCNPASHLSPFSTLTILLSAFLAYIAL